MRPENIPELANYPTVRAFVLNHLEMQFGDVRAMLRLPILHGPEEGRIENGCNFAAASTLCNLISGISVVFFDRQGRPPGPRQLPRDRGARFTRLMARYYPWQPGENISEKTQVLYGLVRNPVAHALGVLEPREVPVICDKLGSPSGMSQRDIDTLDVVYDGGGCLPQALQMGIDTLGNDFWDLRLPFLYGATVELFRRLVADPQQMRQTEACFSRGEFTD